jgi:hypothetical protein
MNMAEIESEGLKDAREVLRRAPRASVRHLRDVCLRQDLQALDGKRFDTCGFGNLSQGVGYNFHNMTNDDVIDSVVCFAHSIGVMIELNVLTPFEKFCMNMNPKKFALLASLCEEALQEDGAYGNLNTDILKPKLEAVET